MSSKRARSNSKVALMAIEQYGTQGVPAGMRKGPIMMTSPGTLQLAKDSGPPSWDSLDGETQEMAILAELTMPEDHGA
jgi:hypothetical protein